MSFVNEREGWRSGIIYELSLIHKWKRKKRLHTWKIKKARREKNVCLSCSQIFNECRDQHELNPADFWWLWCFKYKQWSTVVLVTLLPRVTHDKTLTLFKPCVRAGGWWWGAAGVLRRLLWVKHPTCMVDVVQVWHVAASVAFRCRRTWGCRGSADVFGLGPAQCATLQLSSAHLALWTCLWH